MDCWRQWIRHRTASVNEYSTRYSVAIDSAQRTPVDLWRRQSAINNQGSAGKLSEWPADYHQDTVRRVAEHDITSQGIILDSQGEFVTLAPSTPGEFLSSDEEQLHKLARMVYQRRIEMGVAREQARKDLPLCTYTEAYWKCDLRNIMNFLSLRMDSHAQLEIRQYAQAMYEIVKQLYPIAMEAFDDYDIRRGGLQLTRLDIDIIKSLDGFSPPIEYREFLHAVEWAKIGWPTIGKCRERDECYAKLLRMGLAKPNDQPQ